MKTWEFIHALFYKHYLEENNHVILNSEHNEQYKEIN